MGLSPFAQIFRVLSFANDIFQCILMYNASNSIMLSPQTEQNCLVS